MTYLKVRLNQSGEFTALRIPSPEDNRIEILQTDDDNAAGFVSDIELHSKYHVMVDGKDMLFQFRGMADDKSIWRRIPDHRETPGLIGHFYAKENLDNVTGNGTTYKVAFDGWTDGSYTLQPGIYRPVINLHLENLTPSANRLYVAVNLTAGEGVTNLTLYNKASRLSNDNPGNTVLSLPICFTLEEESNISVLVRVDGLSSDRVGVNPGSNIALFLN